MGKSSNDAPAPPDYAALTQGQAEANRINVTSPYGTATYSGPNKSNLNISLSPNQQALLGGVESIQGNLASTGQTLSGQLPQQALDFEGLPGQVSNLDMSGLTSYLGQDAQTGQQVADAVYESTASRLRNEFDTRNRQQEQMLADRGIPITSEAYRRTLDQEQQRQNDALSKASLDATIAGSDLGYRARNQGLSELGIQANLQNQARTQGITERQALRANPYNELAAILGGTPVQQPTVIAPTPIDVTGPASLAYSGQLNAYNNAQANRQANLGGLYSLGAAALPFAFG